MRAFRVMLRLALCLLLSAAALRAEDRAGEGSIALVDMRPVLARLSLTVGPNDQLALVRAQASDDPKAIVLSNGDYTLADLAAADAAGAGLDVADGAVATSVPLVIWSGARLTLGPGDTLRMRRDTGAFLLNFGELSIEGASVAGVGEGSLRAPEFRPFVLTAGTGRLTAEEARFSALGFGRNRNFGGVSVVNRGIFRPDGPSPIIGTTFSDVTAINFDSSDAVTFTDNEIAGGPGVGVQLTDVKTGTVARNLIGGTARHAIVARGETGALSIHGNVVEDIGGIGIFLDRGVHGVTVADNRLDGAGGGGVSLVGVTCARVTGNEIARSGQKGLSVRRGDGILLADNRLDANRSAGIYIADQSEGAVTVLSDNVLTHNHSGLVGSNAETVILAGNDFSSQFPRLLGGELARAIRIIGGDLEGQTTFEIAGGAVSSRDAVPAPCPEATEL